MGFDTQHNWEDGTPPLGKKNALALLLPTITTTATYFLVARAVIARQPYQFSHAKPIQPSEPPPPQTHPPKWEHPFSMTPPFRLGEFKVSIMFTNTAAQNFHMFHTCVLPPPMPHAHPQTWRCWDVVCMRKDAQSTITQASAALHTWATKAKLKQKKKKKKSRARFKLGSMRCVRPATVMLC